ncbi:MAG: protein kinase [Elusimicrobia bacterium]|nr:protein kinase [Elusimicrobiota bacterium]
MAAILISAGPLTAQDTPGKPDRPDPVESFLSLTGLPEEAQQQTDDAKNRMKQKPRKEREDIARSTIPEITRTIRTRSSRGRIPAPGLQPINDLATLANQFGQNGDAVSLSDTVLQNDPGNRDALNNRAIGRFGLKDYAAAIADATRVTRSDPDNETAYTTRALSYYESGDYLRAIEDARRALHLNRNNEVAFATLRLAEGRLGPSHLALNDKQRLQADGVKREYLAKLEQEGRTETALVREAPAGHVTLGPEGELVRQASTYAARGRPWEAIDFATRALRANPKNAQAYHIRASAFNSVQQYTKAVRDAEEALKLDPASAGSLDAKAAALIRMGRYLEAEQDCERSIALNARNPFAHLNCGRARIGLGNLKRAVEDLNNAAILNPQFEGEYRKAVEALSQKALVAKRSDAARPQETPAPRSPWHGYIATTLFTLAGGVLIALGVIHLTTLAARGDTATDSAPSDPSILGHYKIVRKIAHGGMGVVYEALDQSLNRKVAIKKMRDEFKLSAPERKRFIQEARIVAALHHPNIVDIHTVLERGDDLFLVFEHVDGRTLAEILKEDGPLPLEETRRIMRGVVEALEYAHRHGVIHRDLKPSNIMLTEERQAKVMDFGIARLSKAPAAEADTSVVGTPQYMSPEAERGVVRPESDVYGLGACLYEMLTAKRAFGGSDPSPHKMALDYPRLAKLRPDLPPALDALILKALNPDPDQRPRSPAKFAQELEAIEEARVV